MTDVLGERMKESPSGRFLIEDLASDRVVQRDHLATKDVCDGCGIEEGGGIVLRRCANCRYSRFCSRQCRQLAAWNDGSHKRVALIPCHYNDVDASFMISLVACFCVIDAIPSLGELVGWSHRARC